MISKVSDKNDINLEKITKALKPIDPIENEEKDLLKDNFEQISINSEISVKKSYDVSKLDLEIYERYISILARVYKTMDGVTDLKLLSEILDFLLETYINFGFYFIEEFEKDISEINPVLNKITSYKIRPFHWVYTLEMVIF